MRDFFGRLFGEAQKPRREEKPAPPLQRDAAQQEAVELYKKGDVIGRNFEVHGTLAKGGFGIVFLAYDRRTKEMCALKTFRDEMLGDAAARQAFKKEALIWVGLEEHPFILAARWVEVDSGRLFVAMDYIAPDELRRVSLADHLERAGGPLDTDQALRWAIQFCHGMEHANAHGIKCHRDIKPGNILITQDRTLKIADFGLAAAAEASWRGHAAVDWSVVGDQAHGFGFSLLLTENRKVCGTPGYIPPEVYRGEGGDVRGDIYSFGLVLWQMAAGSSTPPFVVPYHGDVQAYVQEIYRRQMTGPVPPVNSVLGPMIERCLAPEPAERYGDFRQLRQEAEEVHWRRTGQSVQVPSLEKGYLFLTHMAVKLDSLGQHEQAIGYWDRLLEIEPREAMTWHMKAYSLGRLGRLQEAIECCDQALAIEPQLRMAWYYKGVVLAGLGRCEAAIGCYDRALAIDPRSAGAWYEKGRLLEALGRREEALVCIDRSIEIEPREAEIWAMKAFLLYGSRRPKEALSCLERAVSIAPRCAKAWYAKAVIEEAEGRRAEAACSYRHLIAIHDPEFAAQAQLAHQKLRELDEVRGDGG